MQIRVKQGSGSDRIIEYQRGQKISDALAKAGIYLPLPCGGRGSCGKCIVRFLNGTPEPSEADRRLLTENDLTQGMRLACQCVLSENPCDASEVVIEIPDATDESGMEVQTDGVCSSRITADQKRNLLSAVTSSHDQSKDDYGIAIDIGTTTIAMELIRLSDDAAISTWSGVNHQRMYGADVMSRIAYANASEDHARQLQEMIREDLQTGFNLFKKACPGEIVHIAIAGNVTMIHLLMGYSTAHLGEAPFTAQTLDAIHTRMDGVPCDIFPAIQAFVGGDIVAGVYAAAMDQSNDLSLLVDFGTNGEMVLGDLKHFTATSVSAGPAFEGGHIRFGMPSVPGAINSVMIVGRFCRTTTIGGKPAVGICGTGLLDAVSELLRNHLIDTHGTLIDEYRDTGYPLVRQRGSQVGFGSCVHPGSEEILITQEDIRQIQLAKGSIRAGMDVLLSSAGYRYADLKHIYLAGGFGFHLDVKKAVRLGIFPEEVADRVLPVGNSALAGAREYLLHPEDQDRIDEICKHSQTVSLANSDAFHQRYIECMDF